MILSPSLSKASFAEFGSEVIIEARSVIIPLNVILLIRTNSLKLIGSETFL